MRTRRIPLQWIAIALAAVGLALVPVTAYAQVSTDSSAGFSLRAGGDVTVEEGERIDTLVVIGGDVTLLGDVTDLVVVGGNTIVEGTVRGSLTAVGGDVTLQSTANVGDVYLVAGTVARDPGATVRGSLEQRDAVDIPLGILTLLSIYFWIAWTLFALTAGLLFAAIGGAQLKRTATTMTGRLVNTIVGGVFFWIGLPVLAVIAMVTLIGLPVGLAIVLFLMPIVWFLGYIVAGARLGRLVLGRFGRGAEARPFAATALGVLLLQLLLLVPGLGFLIVSLAGIWGGAALAYTAFAAAGGRSFEPELDQPIQPA